MLFSFKILKSFFKEKLPEPKIIAEKLTMHSFEVEVIKKVNGDFLFDIDVLPNRSPDCFSHYGLAREISVLFDLNLKSLNSNFKEIKNKKTSDFLTIKVENKEDCRRYIGRIVFDLKVKESPKWLKETLNLFGINSINNIVDLANYVMLETGQPLHVFDFDKIASNKSQKKEIIVRRAKNKEKIITLDKKEYDLDNEILVISDRKGPLAIAGVKGGKRAEVSEKTKNIIIESANFNQRIIRKASRKLKLRTDASWRFENGLDPNLASFAINRFLHLIQESSGGKILKSSFDFYPEKVLPKRIMLDINYLKSLLGEKIEKKEILKIIKKLNFKILRSSKNSILVRIPTFRLDISIPEDLIEEIARIYGFEKISPKMPRILPSNREQYFSDTFFEKKIRDFMIAVGFSETYNYSFFSLNLIKMFSFKKDNLIELENPVSSEYQFLRNSLIPNLILDVEKNQANYKIQRLFEIGKVFSKNRSGNSFFEKKEFAGLIFNENRNIEGFYELKGIIDSLFKKLGINSIFYDDYGIENLFSDYCFLHPKRVAEIKVDNKKVGFLGEVSPLFLKKIGVLGTIFLFSLDFEKIKSFEIQEYEFQPIPVFPAVVRDITVLVPKKTKVAEIMNLIYLGGGEFLRDVDLFDIYYNENLKQDKKSLSFHLIFQSEDKNLDSKTVNKILKNIINFLEKRQNFEVKK